MAGDRRNSWREGAEPGRAAAGWVVAASVLFLRHPIGLAVPEQLVRATPADAVVAYYIDGRADPRGADHPRSSLELAGFLIDRAREFGFLNRLDEATRTRLDIFSTLGLAFEHPHAVMLFDIRAQPRAGDSHRLASLQAGLVLLTGGDNARIEQRIQHFLSAYTNTTDSRLSSRSVGGQTVYVLHDTRLADWVEVAWGAIGDRYLVTVGTGALDALEGVLTGSRPSLYADEWFRRSWDDLHGDAAAFAAHVRFDRLRTSDDQALAQKVDRAMGALGADGVERGLWSVGQRDRAIQARGIIRREGRDEIHRLTAAGGQADSAKSVVPDEATGYAALDVEPANLIHAVGDAYLAGRSPDRRRNIVEFWERLQTESGVSIDRDLLSRLRPPWVAHNAPPHALGLPLAWTRVIRIDGDIEEFRRNLDRLLGTARAALPPEKVTQLRRDPDGVWHLEFGLEGPGLAVVDSYLVISFSPEAVRQNTAFLRARRAHSATPAPSTPPP